MEKHDRPQERGQRSGRLAISSRRQLGIRSHDKCHEPYDIGSDAPCSRYYSHRGHAWNVTFSCIAMCCAIFGEKEGDVERSAEDLYHEIIIDRHISSLWQ